MGARQRSAKPKVMVISSPGGHWVQIRRLRPAWTGCAVTYVTTDPGYLGEIAKDPVAEGSTPPRFFVVPDANRWNKMRLAVQMLMILAVVVRIRPDVIITTGAAPGYFAVRFGNLIGARTIWIDSIANAEKLSLSGQMAGRFCTLWLTQYQHLARTQDQQGPSFKGSVI